MYTKHVCFFLLVLWGHGTAVAQGPVHYENSLWECTFNGPVSGIREYNAGFPYADTTEWTFSPSGKLIRYAHISRYSKQVAEPVTDTHGNVWPVASYHIFERNSVPDTVWSTRYVLDTLAGTLPAYLYEIGDSGDTIGNPSAYWIHNGRVIGMEDGDNRQWFTYTDSLGMACKYSKQLYKRLGTYSGNYAFYHLGTGRLARTDLTDNSARGELFRTITYDGLGNPLLGSWDTIQVLQFEYITDSHGNWTERNRYTVLPGQKKHTQTLRRVITYFE